MTQPRDRAWLFPALLAGFALLVLCWSYAATIGDIAWRWQHDPQYSHGFLVPVFALTLCWMRRRRLDVQALRPHALGLAIICLATSLRLCGAYFHYTWLDQISLVGTIAGLVLLAGGRAAWRWAWPAVAFLGFMIPLPHKWEVALSGPMQTFATEASTFALQILGRPALAEGNVILLNDIELGIVEACSGLRMLVVFFALSSAVALLIHKPAWERALIALSALPIALVANVLRITVTGILYDTAGPELGNAIFHDLMGWLMMPIGLAFLGLELWILSRLLLAPVRNNLMGGTEVSLHRAIYNPVGSHRGESRPRPSAVQSPEPVAQS